jgi:hypothetical protein
MDPLRHLPARCPIGAARSITVLGHVASDPPLASNGTVDDVGVALSRSKSPACFERSTR